LPSTPPALHAPTEPAVRLVDDALPQPCVRDLVGLEDHDALVSASHSSAVYAAPSSWSITSQVVTSPRVSVNTISWDGRKLSSA
jgi:hypothetical protein